VRIWQQALCARLTAAAASGQSIPPPEPPGLPPVSRLVPSPVRWLLFAHWLAGERQTEQVIGLWNLDQEDPPDDAIQAKIDRLSSRAAHNLYRADDLEDARFHLDWTMMQMLAPGAALQRAYVLRKSRLVLGSFDQG